MNFEISCRKFDVPGSSQKKPLFCICCQVACWASHAEGASQNPRDPLAPHPGAVQTTGGSSRHRPTLGQQERTRAALGLVRGGRSEARASLRSSVIALHVQLGSAPGGGVRLDPLSVLP